MTPDNKLAILVSRGNEGTPTKPEDPGALKVFDYKDGVLSNEVSVAPNGGKEFGPRHLDFHPTKPWVYVSIETQNKMYMFPMENGRINAEIAFIAEPWPSRTTSGRGRRRARCMSTRTAAFCMAPTAPSRPRTIKDRRCSRAARTHRRVRDRPIDWRAEADPEHRNAEIHPRRFISTRAAACSWRAQSAGQGARRRSDQDRDGRPLGAPHRRRRQARLRPQYDIDVGDKTMLWMGMVPLPA